MPERNSVMAKECRVFSTTIEIEIQFDMKIIKPHMTVE